MYNLRDVIRSICENELATNRKFSWKSYCRYVDPKYPRHTHRHFLIHQCLVADFRQIIFMLCAPYYPQLHDLDSLLFPLFRFDCITFITFLFSCFCFRFFFLTPLKRLRNTNKNLRFRSGNIKSFGYFLILFIYFFSSVRLR